MSLLSVVEQAIESCKAEQTRIHDSIQLYRKFIHSLAPQQESSLERSEPSGAAATDTDGSPGEKEDIELLEQALEKALRIRSSSCASVKDPDGLKQARRLKEPGNSKDSQSSASFKGHQTTIRSTSKLIDLDRKDQKKPGSSREGSQPSASNNPGKSKHRSTIQTHPVSSAEVVHHQAARKLQQAGSVSGSRSSTLHSKNRTIKSSVLSAGDPGKAAAISAPPSNNTLPSPQTHEAAAHSLLQNDGITSEQITKWKSLRNKQNRLWDKAVALQRNPVPGRSHFMERMRDTFPEESSDQSRAPADWLTHQGHDLTHRCRTQKLLAKPTPEPAAVIEMETRDRWRLEGGCLPPTITYTTEAELREVEKLRMRVALLQQEVNLEQALLDTLSPQLSSIAPGPGCPSATVLRDMYSLLGEGGERFPTIVLDSEPD